MVKDFQQSGNKIQQRVTELNKAVTEFDKEAIRQKAKSKILKKILEI